MTIGTGPDGQPLANPIAGTTFQPVASSARNARLLMNPSTGEQRYVADPSYGPVAEGTHLTAQGAERIPGTQLRPLVSPAERQAAGIQPFDRAGYAQKPDGSIVKTADDPFGPAAQLDYSARVTASDPYKRYVAARQNLDAMRDLMKQPGGFSDLSLIENAGKTINPDIAIRPNMIDQYGKEVGLPDWLVGEMSSVMNHGGHLTAEGRNALFNIAQTNTQSHWNALQPLLGKVDYDAKRYGLTRQDLLPDLLPMIPQQGPSYPGATVPGGGNPDAAASIAAARAAIAKGAPRGAVIQRLQAAGIDPRGL